MRIRLPILLAAAAALIVPPASAGAPAPAVVKVRACETGDASRERLATFYGRMRAVPGTHRMQMRFTLIDRSSGRAGLVPTPKLAKWRKSKPGVMRFGYSQTIVGLQRGAAYAVTVEFRWRDERGKTIKRLRRTSSDCRQEGELPNLAVAGIEAKPGDAVGTFDYEISVVNKGGEDARAFRVDLLVDGATADAAEIDLLEPGETVSVEISGPACQSRIRAVIDRRNAVRETIEDDNGRSVRCPTVAP
jgi:CARDB